MKTYSASEFKLFAVQDPYEIVYDHIYNYKHKLVILKPKELSKEFLQNFPIIVTFYKIKTFEITVEFKIYRQSQLVELFKILNRLNVSRSSIGYIFIAILTSWVDYFKDKDVETVKYPTMPSEFYKLLFQNDKQETFKDGTTNLEYIKTEF